MIFTKLTALIHVRTEMKTSEFGVRVQGHSALKYAGSSTDRGLRYNHLTLSLEFLVLSVTNNSSFHDLLCTA